MDTPLLASGIGFKGFWTDASDVAMAVKAWSCFPIRMKLLSHSEKDFSCRKVWPALRSRQAIVAGKSCHGSHSVAAGGEKAMRNVNQYNITEAVAAEGSLIAGIEALVGGPRTFRRFEPGSGPTRAPVRSRAGST